MLPDDVLLEIFDFYVVRISRRRADVESWQLLVHVCRRWRCLVFGSPRRLNLQLFCTPETRIRDTLDVWPALPLVLYHGAYMALSSPGMVNVLAALEQSNRVSEVTFTLSFGSQLEEVLAVMQVPFPELTNLRLMSNDETLPVIADPFLGGSAPRLRSLMLDGIILPGLPKLLLSAPHLVKLDLRDIPDPGYTPPEAMATCLSALTSLHTLCLEFRSGPDRESRHSPPMTRSILPDLASIRFKGASEYLDYLVAWIDAPRLNELSITFFPQINFDTPHLVQFISRTPGFKEPNEAHVNLNPDAEVRLVWASDGYGSVGKLCVKILCEESDPQLLFIVQVCTMCLPPFPTVENFRLGVFTERLYSETDWTDDVGQWWDLLRPFTAVKNLYISEGFQLNMAFALRELAGGRTTEVLPSLQNIFLERFEPYSQEAIRVFIATRQLSGRPIAVL